MVKILTGDIGEGKTKKILDMANDAIKNSHGHIVFIDNDKDNIYGLNYNIRFVETSGFPLSNYRELIGFLCGILSQDNDIEKIYIDGLYKILKNLNSEDLIKLAKKLQDFSEKNSVDFIISISISSDKVPKEISDMLI